MSTHAEIPATAGTAPSPVATLGARLAAESRRAQGFTTVVDNPAVLDKLRGLCTAPRPTSLSVAEKRDGPAP